MVLGKAHHIEKDHPFHLRKRRRRRYGLCSYARNGELRFVCADVYAVDCDSAGFKYEVHAV